MDAELETGLARVRALRAAGRDDDRVAAAMALAERYTNSAEAQIEAAYACDFVGRETDAVRYYDAAWRLGIPVSGRADFLVGYGSTLRNVGRTEEAVQVLRAARAEFPADRAVQTFLALALHSARQHAAALATALDAILELGDGAPDVRRYARALASYRDELMAEAREPGAPAAR